MIHVAGEGARARVERLASRAITDRPRVAGLRQDGEILDEVMVRLAPGFTGEETVEITCHGGPACVERILSALESLGVARVDTARLLERGIETGHLDRIRAEAWTLLPRTCTGLAARVLHDQAEGALSRALEAMETPGDAKRLLATAPLGMALARPPRVVLAGAPNVGKSSLFNALLGKDRVLVSPTPGTTRDPVREIIAIEQVPVELVDTAGVEDPRDLLEQLSIECTHRVLREADVILFVFDAVAGPQGDEMRFLERLAHRRAIPLVNKIDAGTKKPLLGALPVSARTGAGLEDLRRGILQALGIEPRYEPGRAVVFTHRQKGHLERAASQPPSIDEIRRALLREDL